MPPEDPAAFRKAAREEDKTRQGNFRRHVRLRYAHSPEKHMDVSGPASSQRHRVQEIVMPRCQVRRAEVYDAGDIDGWQTDQACLQHKKLPCTRQQLL